MVLYVVLQEPMLALSSNTILFTEQTRPDDLSTQNPLFVMENGFKLSLNCHFVWTKILHMIYELTLSLLCRINIARRIIKSAIQECSLITLKFQIKLAISEVQKSKD